MSRPRSQDLLSSVTSPIGLAAAAMRVSLIVVVLGGGIIGGLAWWTLNREATLRAEISALETRMATEIATREATIERLGRDRRVARIEVLDRQEGPPGEDPTTLLRFIELDDEGRELGRQDMNLRGEIVHVDAWTARFPSETVGSGEDPLRDRTLVLLRRIYTDAMPPRAGVPLDTPGGVPDGYTAGEPARFEQAIWKRFWRLASDPEAAREAGIRVAQGEAVYKPMQPGEVYELRVEALGGMTLVPLGGRADATEAGR
ncbi:MAG: hypothetical protein CMJ67_07950 [Planctomycetaceae bacterium]|nr:hypothetical protein [Planctomycetaceae bacterium]